MKRVAREFLINAELKMIEDKKFESERLILIQDLFIFSCYTGLAYGDLMALKPLQIIKAKDGELWIKPVREKTDERVNLPLLPTAVDIINKYKGNVRSLYKDTVSPTSAHPSRYPVWPSAIKGK